MHLKRSRSDSFFRNRLRKTTPLQSLGAPDPPTILPSGVDARSSLQLPQYNLGSACRVGKHLRSLQKKSSRAQKQAVSFPGYRTAPAYNLRRSLSEMTLPQHLALEEKTRQKLLQNDPPPIQLSHVVAQLRAELCTLQHVVRQLAELQSVACSKKRDNIELGENSARNKTNNNNNDDDDDNNKNDHNKNSQESGLNSLDLDDDNPESESDLDRTSLVSFNPSMGQVESGLGSLDQQEADLSFDNLGHQTMTVASSLGSLDQQQQDEQEGKTTRMSFGKTQPKKRVTFSKATLAAYNEKGQNKENRCCKTTLACWNNFQQAHHKTQEAWQEGPRRCSIEPTSSLGEQELSHQEASEQNIALDAGRQVILSGQQLADQT